MIIRIDRATPMQTGANGNIAFEAVGDDATRLLVEMDRTAWHAIRNEWPHDPLAGVEEVARQGHWARSADRRVWRIDFV